MVQSQYSVSWDSYNSNICKGFSALQQNGEFVDMTLAADGYYVKVHQILVALASPYLKELISTAPCPHPVVFLNNISHKTLSLILEYIYTGEVLVAADNLASFAEAAKSLHIKGLENFTNNENLLVKMSDCSSKMEDGELCHVSGIKRLAVPVSQRIDQIGLPAAARKICIKKEKPFRPNIKSEHKKTTTSASNQDDSLDYEVPMDDILHDDDDDDQNDSIFSADKNNTNNTSKPVSTVQFTVSIRGSLQIVLNRYIYNMHSVARNGVRRWRCVDYRNNKCSAFVVTKGNVVLNRGNLHNHSFHDKKILAKIEKKCVFSALDDVKGYNKEQEEANISEGQDIMELDDSNDIGDKSTDYIL